MAKRPELIDAKDYAYLRKRIRKTVPAKQCGDVVQDAAIRIWKAKAGSRERLKRRYLDRAAESAIADHYRKQASDEAKAVAEPKIETEPAFEGLVQLSDDRTQMLLTHTAPPDGWDGTSGAWRKARSLARDRMEAKLIALWIERRELDALNRYRPAEKICGQAARLLLSRGVPLAAVQAAFARPTLNRAIQTSTWVMTAIGRQRRSESGRVWAFIVDQLRRPHLYRGNRTYCCEALLEADRQAGADIYRHLYLRRVHEMEARVGSRRLPPREEKPVLRRCIYDVKAVHRLGSEIPRDEVLRIKQMYLSGADCVDLHRSLAYALLRSRPDDTGGLDAVVGALRDDMDQTNAYFVAKYIRRHGWKEAPQLRCQETLRSLRAVARRWPQNPFFRDTATRFAQRLQR